MATTDQEIINVARQLADPPAIARGGIMYAAAGHAIRKWLHNAAVQLAQTGIEEGIKKGAEEIEKAVKKRRNNKRKSLN